MQQHIYSQIHVKMCFFAMKEELYYMIAGYINTLQALWIKK
jgi:hypothetical protein